MIGLSVSSSNSKKEDREPSVQGPSKTHAGARWPLKTKGLQRQSGIIRELPDIPKCETAAAVIPYKIQLAKITKLNKSSYFPESTSRHAHRLSTIMDTPGV